LILIDENAGKSAPPPPILDLVSYISCSLKVGFWLTHMKNAMQFHTCKWADMRTHTHTYTSNRLPSCALVHAQDAPLLPGGCRQGELTKNGYLMAQSLGSWLRSRYTQQLPFLSKSFKVRWFFVALSLRGLGLVRKRLLCWVCLRRWA